MNKLKVVYATRYNGVSIIDENGDDITFTENEQRAVAQAAASDIIEHAGQDCDDDGYWEGDDNKLEEFATKTIRNYFGDTVLVEVEFDEYSS